MELSENIADNRKPFPIKRLDGRNWRIFSAKCCVLILSLVYVVVATFIIINGEGTYFHLWPQVWTKFEIGTQSRFEWARFSSSMFALIMLMVISFGCTGAVLSHRQLIAYTFCLNLLMCGLHSFTIGQSLAGDWRMNIFFVFLHGGMFISAGWLWLLRADSNVYTLRRMLREDMAKSKEEKEEEAVELRNQTSNERKEFRHLHHPNKRTENDEEFGPTRFDIEEELDRTQLETMVKKPYGYK